MKKVILILSIFFVSFSCFAQSIKDYVCIVSASKSDEEAEYLANLKTQLQEKGYNRYVEAVENAEKGTFGSGFVYIGEDKKPYVITNHHVLSHYKAADISFEDNKSGEKIEYKKLKVIAADDEIDICILAFSEGKSNLKTGLTFSTLEVNDGDEVWSAGFPGLGGSPLWQLGKGNVTNARAAIKELIEPSVSTVIQHSANVDGGNSGGPLLMASKTAAAKYQVVGVNTWKARYRDGTNFSIPSKIVKKIADDAVSGKKMNPEKKEEVQKKFAENLEKAQKDKNLKFIMKYVSYNLAERTPVDSFIDVLKFAPSSIRDSIVYYFYEDPLEGMRAVAAWNILNEFSKSENKDSSSFASEKDWILEDSYYRITNNKIEETKGKSKKNKSTAKSSGKDKNSIKWEGIDNPWFFTVTAGVNVLKETSFKGEYDSDYSDCSCGTGFNAFLRVSRKFLSANFGVETCKMMNNSFTYVDAGGQLGLPLNFTQLFVNPFVRGDAGFGSDILKFSAEAGIEFIAGHEDWTVNPGLGFSYGKSFYTANFDSYKSDNIKIYGMLAF